MHLGDHMKHSTTHFHTSLINLVLLLMVGQVPSLGQHEISLDGEWEIIFDEENIGRHAHWHRPDIFDLNPDKRFIDVPSAWELIKQDYEGVAFYKKAFSVPADWKEKVIRLQFGAVNYLAEVWLNEEVVGYHEGGFTPFEFRVDEMINAGKSNVLVLRVVGPITLADKKIDGIGKMETPQWRGGLTAGIWQEVKLVATNDIFIDDVFIQPDIHQHNAKIQIELDHTGTSSSKTILSIEISEAHSSKQVATLRKTVHLHPGKNKRSYTLNIPNAQYWSPDSPHLYRCEIKTIHAGITSDSWEAHFGMRELTIVDKDFYLNGKRIYIRASFFEGLYPNGIAYPDNEEMARKEIQLAKDAGFNMIRPWRRPPVPMWLDLADEMGVMVVGSPALECMTLPLSTPYLPRRVEHEVSRSIQRDRNRACIVQWELFNELHRPVLKQLMRPMAMLARSLDPTRLILDESGGWAYGANMYLPYEYEPTKFNDIHNYPGPFINSFRYDGYLSIGLTEDERQSRGYRGSKVGRNVIPNLMSYVSELGYGSLPDLTVVNTRFRQDGHPLTPAYRYHHRLDREQRQMLVESGFSNLYPKMQQFYLDQQQIHGTANKRMVEAVRSNPEVDGYCIHALIGGDWVLGAGLIDLWRQPKGYVYEATKAANQPRIVSIRMTPRNAYAEMGTHLEITGINDQASTPADLDIKILNSQGKIVYRETRSTQWKSGVNSLFQSELSTDNWNGTHNVKVSLTASDGTMLTENSYHFDVFSQQDLHIPNTKVALMNLEGPLYTVLERKNLDIVLFNENISASTPVLVTNTKLTDQESVKQFADLLTFVEKGGTAIYIEGVKSNITADHPAFPFTATVHPARGLWTCIPHLVHQHPIFQGLPANTPMRDIYENVWATTTLRDLKIKGVSEIKPIVASIGFDWFSKGHKMHYSGPGASWWGSDMVLLPYGKGRCLVSQLDLVRNLNKDPVADKILANMIKYLAQSP